MSFEKKLFVALAVAGALFIAPGFSRAEESAAKEKPAAAPALASQAAVAVEAVKPAVAVNAGPKAWDSLPPEIQVNKIGAESRIIVVPNKSMKPEEFMKINSVRLETEKGEFLGLKTWAAAEKDRTSEFMINTEILKIKKAKVTVTSSTDGSWTKVFSLESTEKPAEKSAAPVVPAPVVPKVSVPPVAAAPAAVAKKVEKMPAPKEKTKKKGLF